MLPYSKVSWINHRSDQLTERVKCPLDHGLSVALNPQLENSIRQQGLEAELETAKSEYRQAVRQALDQVDVETDEVPSSKDDLLNRLDIDLPKPGKEDPDLK